MSILNTFFLRYKADTGQATKDIEKLGKTEDEAAKKHKKNTDQRKKDNKELGESFKDVVAKSKEFGKNLGKLGEHGNKLGALRGVVSSLSDVVGGLGPAAAIAVVGIGAVVGAVAIARKGIDEARESAKEAIELGEKAFDARLSQNELIRMQSHGRAMGLSDDQVAASARGMQDKGAEIRAAQRQAARDPASAFNNPLIKQGNLFKKAGVDVSASLEKQVQQQDKYLRALQATNQGERALIEGTQLFGRTLADIKAVISTSQSDFDSRLLSMAKENELRRGLQKSGEALANAEQKLTNSRKAADERTLSHTVPATEKFTKAVDEWTRSTAPLQDAWGIFVADLISGMTKIVGWGTKFANMVGLGSDARTVDEKVRDVGNDAAEAARQDYVNKHRSFFTGVKETEAMRNSPEATAAADAARAKAEAEERARLIAQGPARQKDLAGLSQQAKNELVQGGKFDGKDVSADRVDEAMKAVNDAIKNDPNIKTLEDIKTLLSDQLHTQVDQGKVQKAQTDYTKKIENNTLALVNTGLEQAMALWAANVGAGSGVSAGGFRGETSGAYEARARNMQRTINPNASYKMSMDRAAVGQMDGQADALNKSKTGGQPTGQPANVQIDKVEVHSHKADVAGVAQDMADHVKNQLRYAVAEFASPVVS